MIQLFFKKSYEKVLSKINSKKFTIRILPVLFFYFITTFGFLLFVLPNIRSNHILIDSLYYGGIFGFLLYTFYSTTIYALIEPWTLQLTIIDIIWGTVLGFIVTYGTSLIKFKYLV